MSAETTKLPDTKMVRAMTTLPVLLFFSGVFWVFKFFSWPRSAFSAIDSIVPFFLGFFGYSIFFLGHVVPFLLWGLIVIRA